MAPTITMLESGGGGDLPAKRTFQVYLCSIIAAFGGLMFGYDVGISGGVTSMDDFLIKFFPDVYVKKHHVRESNYCKYDNEYLQLFTSSLYLAAIVACFFASMTNKKYGRKPTMQAASVFFLAGALLNLFAANLEMLIVGRILLGAGVGFGNQTVPLFISEIAPPKYRGYFNITFQLLITIGILVANLINYWTSHVRTIGWRISLGGAVVPALILLIGSLFIVETPTSLINRGKLEEGRAALEKIRGVKNVDKEYQEILEATEEAKQVKNSYKNLIMKRSNWPQLICGTLIQVFQQFTGINVIMFYAPVLFQTIGYESNASLMSSAIIGGVNVLATLVSNIFVDKAGRRFLLLQAVFQMLISQCVMGGILAAKLKTNNTMSHGLAVLVVILVCIFVSAFAWSWGPLGWLVASEIFPLETRNAGFFFAVSTNMLFTFVVAQAFLTMLCRMRSGIFFFFAGCIVFMGCFAYFILPETKGVPIDEMNEKVWKKHWLWKRFFDDDYGIENKEIQLR